MWFRLAFRMLLCRGTELRPTGKENLARGNEEPAGSRRSQWGAGFLFTGSAGILAGFLFCRLEAGAPSRGECCGKGDKPGGMWHLDDGDFYEARVWRMIVEKNSSPPATVTPGGNLP